MKKSLLFLALAAALAGCGDSSPAAQTDEQVKDFKGGPMPTDVAARISAAQKGGAEAGAKAAAEHAGKGP